MRLLHTETYRLHDYFCSQVPRYAILSHTWGDREISYEEIQAATDPSAIPEFSKIQGACALVKSEGFEFIWIDTCCINKSSSSELSEAINSMYLWYQKAEVCYAYLATVESQPESSSTFQHPQMDCNLSSHPRFSHFKESAFRNSRWFERGWTLQELIAPSNVIFCSKDWKLLGSKLSLKGIISSVTNIEEIIIGGVNLDIFSVARKMSWASKRKTKREEDMAYCLLGIFSVNMPLLYGEGKEKAFIRLQEHIIARSNDQSIFAWTLTKRETLQGQHYGLLAPSPKAFEDTGKRLSLLSPNYRKQRSIKVVNSAIEVGVILREKGSCDYDEEEVGSEDPELDPGTDYFKVVLDCQIGSTGKLWAGFEIKTMNPEDGREGRLFSRTKPYLLEEFRMKEQSMTRRAYHVVHGGPPPSQGQMSLIESYTVAWKGFWYSCKPWDLEIISVPQNSLYFQPRGFRLQMDDYKFEVSQFPADRWFGHDKILLLSSYAQVATHLPKAERTTHLASKYSREEGTLQIDIDPGTPAAISFSLMLGIEDTVSDRGSLWQKKPWCWVMLVGRSTELNYEVSQQQESDRSVIVMFMRPGLELDEADSLGLPPFRILQITVEDTDSSGLFLVQLKMISHTQLDEAYLFAERKSEELALCYT